MPRSAAKSKDDKHGRSSSVASPPTQDLDKHGRSSSVQVASPPTQDLDLGDIFCGRLTQAQWMDMLIQEDADETVGMIMEELLCKVMESCLMVDVERQLASFSASWAKSYLTQIVEQQFIYLDEGDGPEEVSKTEDSEPSPTIRDAWAQGCIPTVNGIPDPQPASQQVVDIGQAPEQTEPRANKHCRVVAQTNSSPKQSDKETSPRRSVRDKLYEVHSPRPSQKVDGRKMQQMNLLPKPVPSKLLPVLPCSLEKKDVKFEGKKITHSVSNQMTRSLCQHKDQPIPRLVPSSLPRHCVVPQYKILDNNYKQPYSEKSSGLPKLEPRYNKQQTEWTVTSPRPPISLKDQPERFQRRNKADVALKKSSPSIHRKEGLFFSGPLRLDQMELAQGVSLLDPQAVDMSSFKFNSPAVSTKLRPIQRHAAVPMLSVEQLTKCPPPQVTPLFQSRNWDK